MKIRHPMRLHQPVLLFLQIFGGHLDSYISSSFGTNLSAIYTAIHFPGPRGYWTHSNFAVVERGAGWECADGGDVCRLKQALLTTGGVDP